MASPIQNIKSKPFIRLGELSSQYSPDSITLPLRGARAGLDLFFFEGFGDLVVAHALLIRTLTSETLHESDDFRLTFSITVGLATLTPAKLCLHSLASRSQLQDNAVLLKLTYSTKDLTDHLGGRVVGLTNVITAFALDDFRFHALKFPNQQLTSDEVSGKASGLLDKGKRKRQLGCGGASGNGGR